MLFTTVSSAQFADTESSDYKKAISVLQKLYIVEGDENGNFNPLQYVTRSEFAAYVVRFMGLESLAAGNVMDCRYADVDKNNWDYGYVSVADSFGYIEGSPDGNFNGQDNITLEQSFKIVLSALGYKVKCEAQGGYPSGYVSVAQTAGLFEDLFDVSMTQPITREQAAQIIYNALEVPLYETDANGKSTETDKTVLTDNLNVKKAKGIVTANNYAAIRNVSTVGKEQIRIDQKDGSYDVLTTDVFSAIDLLGKEITYYAYNDKDTDDSSLLWFEETISSVSVIDVDSGDIDGDTLKREMTYYTDSKKRTLMLESGYEIIYNGTAYSPAPGEKVIPEVGKVRFIDYDGDDYYEVVSIYSYKSYVFEELNTNTEKTTLKVKKNALKKTSLTFDDSLADLYIFKDGESITVDEIENEDIISVAEDKNGKITTVFVGGEKAEDTVRSITGKGSDTVWTLDSGEEYGVSVMADASEIKAGDSVILYIAFGKVIHVELTLKSDKGYAYLLNCTKGTNPLEEGLWMKLLTVDGVRMHRTAQKVYVERNNSGNSYNWDDNNLYNLVAGQVKQLIIVEFNSENLINKIKTAVDFTTTEGYEGYTDDLFTKDKSERYYFKNVTPPTLGGEYILTDSTLVFNAAELDDAGRRVEEEDMYVGNYTSLGNDRYYIVDIYNANNMRKADAVVIRYDDSGEINLPYNSPCFVVDKISVGMNEDEEPVKLISGLYDGEYVSEILEDDEVLDVTNSKLAVDVIEKGTVMQIKKNFKNEIESVRVLYTPSDDSYKKEQTWSGSGYSIDLYTIYGMVTAIDEDVLCVRTGDEVKPFGYLNAKVYKYNETKNILELADVDEIISYENSDTEVNRVFMRVYRNDVKDIIILY